MNKSDPLPSEHEEGGKTEDDAPSPEKQHKKIRTSPPVEDEDSPRLVDKHSFTTNSSSPATSSPTNTTKRENTANNLNNTTNNATNNTNNTTRHDKDTTEESLYHKRSSKQGRDKQQQQQQKIKKEITTWNPRMRKPGVRFGKEKGEEGEEREDGEGEAENDLTSLPPSSPPSSPHPSDDLTLESLLKHGSGWAFPKEQNGKMICIFRSCPQPLRGGTKKDYVDHLRLHQTMEHTPLYSMLRHAPPGGLIPCSGGPEEEEAPMSQVDGEWEGDEEEAEDEESGTSGTNTQTGSNGTSGGGGTGSGGGAGGEEELHTPKLSQRGLQLRAQMMKYGLNIFRQDTEGRYLCFFMGCTMRMTTNFSRHIAKHEKKMDPISPDLIHLLKEGSSIDKPYMKDKKVKDGNSPLTMMMASSHLIPPPHLSHHMEGLDMSDHVSPHHPLMSSLDIREYRGPPGAHHMQHTLQHMHLQHSSPSTQYMQHMPPHLSKLNIPPPHLSLSHAQAYRHPSHPHMDLHRQGPPSPPLPSSPTNPSEIRWVYRSPFPSPLSVPPNPARRPSLTPDDLTPNAHSPLKHPHQSYPHPASSPRNPLVSPLSRLSTDGDSLHDLSLSNSSSLNSSTLHPSILPDHTKTNPLPLPPSSSSSSDLGAVATSLLDLRKM